MYHFVICYVFCRLYLSLAFLLALCITFFLPVCLYLCLSLFVLFFVPFFFFRCLSLMGPFFVVIYVCLHFISLFLWFLSFHIFILFCLSVCRSVCLSVLCLSLSFCLAFVLERPLSPTSYVIYLTSSMTNMLPYHGDLHKTQVLQTNATF